MYGYKNSTFGIIFTIIGLVYLYIPFMLAPLYTSLVNMPKNLIWASYDMGHGPITTFFKVILPYTFAALMSGITLVFLPSVTTVAVPQFLNSSSDGNLIGDIIVNEGSIAQTSEIALARVSSLSMVLLLILTIGYVGIVYGKKLYKYVMNRIKEKRLESC
jgi:spermidine/putrescine transport system permease protein